ncbi:hypothetical protein [Zunongwangia atlantica]|uniref:Uncharacterized protein n=1 Tax=Zunongwangia atlantica 22II14-10F7 TaxID=1185767 RepID=A0A1Y1SYX7_9FLAO|nr:hypothetical protein [Zunongwangia atlantica]ORL43959.1 hypothetical protein IIF7_18372 [Zunongwangia atlantica 22II14-10F7]
MENYSEIDEKELFINNLSNIIHRLHLSKFKFNRKMNWPTNKLSNILAYKQEPLLKDLKCVREFLGLTTADLLTKALNENEIDELAKRTINVKLVRNISTNQYTGKPISYIIVLLSNVYNLEDEFTNKELINSLPKKFATYSIEWNKTRLKNYIIKTGKKINNNGVPEYKYRLKKRLPSKMVAKAIEKVGEKWLSRKNE